MSAHPRRRPKRSRQKIAGHTRSTNAGDTTVREPACAGEGKRSWVKGRPDRAVKALDAANEVEGEAFQNAEIPRRVSPRRKNRDSPKRGRGGPTKRRGSQEQNRCV